jgi:hypothetical protein
MPTSTVYPNSQILVSSALTKDQINAIIVPLTQGILGLSVDANSGAVRTDWGTEGQPFAEVSDDICYIACVTDDGPYNKVRDKVATQNDDGSVTQNWAYTRIWKISWVLYGPNSTDRGRAIKSGLFMDWVCATLSLSQLFPVTNYEEPRRVPELINGQFWERVDYAVTMYEFVQETITDQTVLSVEVIGNDNSGTIFDVTVK